jgi:hypothetical protein
MTCHPPPILVVLMGRDGKVEVDRSVKFLSDGVAVRLTASWWSLPLVGVMAAADLAAPMLGPKQWAHPRQ